MQRVVMLGQEWTDDCWYASVTVGTMMRLDMVEVGKKVFTTTIKVQTVTWGSGLTVGEATMSLGVGRLDG